MLWRHRHHLRFSSTPAAIAAGLLPLMWILFKSQTVYADDIFLRLSPVLSLWAWSTIATGFDRNPYSTRALQILMFLAVPWNLLHLLDITHWTAITAAGLLHLFGVGVHQSGLSLALPHAAIEVYQGCSGAKMMAQLMGFTWIYCCWFAPKTWLRVVAVVTALGLGFGVNAARVALMAVLAEGAQYDWLAYWHYGDGSLMLPLVTSVVYGLFLWSLQSRCGDRRQPSHSLAV